MERGVSPPTCGSVRHVGGSHIMPRWVLHKLNSFETDPFEFLWNAFWYAPGTLAGYSGGIVQQGECKMLNPTGLLEQAQLRHSTLVQQAEKERLYQQLKANRPGLVRRILDQFKAEAKPSPGRSCEPIPIYGKR